MRFHLEFDRHPLVITIYSGCNAVMVYFYCSKSVIVLEISRKRLSIRNNR